jgi:hypothetical protein
MSRTLSTAAFVLLFAIDASAAVEIRVTSDTAGEEQCIPTQPGGPQVITFHVVATGTDAMSAVSFRVTYPPRLLYLQDLPLFQQTSGTSPFGATVTLDGCAQAPVHIMSVQALAPMTVYQDCDWATVVDVSASDCSSEAVTATGGTSRVPVGTCVITGPADPSPADHAQNVPLDAVLDWNAVGATGGCNLGEILHQSLYFGTTPDPPLVLQLVAWPPEDPGVLQPNTQYYWRVFTTQFFTSSMGPVWTFRTANTTATESTTWGRIKALYRN